MKTNKYNKSKQKFNRQNREKKKRTSLDKIESDRNRKKICRHVMNTYSSGQGVLSSVLYVKDRQEKNAKNVRLFLKTV